MILQFLIKLSPNFRKLITEPEGKVNTPGNFLFASVLLTKQDRIFNQGTSLYKGIFMIKC